MIVSTMKMLTANDDADDDKCVNDIDDIDDYCMMA